MGVNTEWPSYCDVGEEPTKSDIFSNIFFYIVNVYRFHIIVPSTLVSFDLIILI